MQWPNELQQRRKVNNEYKVWLSWGTFFFFQTEEFTLSFYTGENKLVDQKKKKSPVVKRKDGRNNTLSIGFHFLLTGQRRYSCTCPCSKTQAFVIH